MRPVLEAAWRRVVQPSLPWAVAGSVAGGVWALIDMGSTMDHHALAVRLYRAFAPPVLVALILVAALVVGVGKGTVAQAMQRPGRLLLILLAASAAGVCAIWLVHLSAPSAARVSMGYRLTSWWLTILVYGGAFGSAAVLNVRRIEEQARLAAVLARRSLLARQIAQTSLMQARARIDPDMVTRVLRATRERYRTDPAGAAGLLDALVAHLRLAMQRDAGGRSEGGPTLAQRRADAVERLQEHLHEPSVRPHAFDDPLHGGGPR